MQFFYFHCGRAMRCIIVALFIVVLGLGAALNFRTNMEKLTEADSGIAAQASRVNSDWVFGKEHKLPEPIAALIKKESRSNNALRSLHTRVNMNRMDRAARSVPQEKEQSKNHIRYYSIYLLGVLFLLKEQSVITYLHKRDENGGPVRLFAI